MSLIKIKNKNGKQAVSARELESQGYKINPFASLSSNNTIIFNEDGEMIDLLIPFDEIELHTIKDEINTKPIKLEKTYILKDTSSGKFKIGKSININNRLKTLSTGNPNLELILQINNNIEKELHEHFKIKRVSGEWFCLNDEDLKYIKEKYK